MTPPENEMQSLNTRDVGPAVGRVKLSRPQFAIWLGQEMYPESPVYNVGHICEFRGPIDAERFDKAFNELMRSADIFRTRILKIENEPYLEFFEGIPKRLTHLDAESAEEVERKTQAAIRRPFAIDTCLYDSVLFRVKPDLWYWYLGMHHLVSDAQTFVIAVRDLEKMYVRGGDESKSFITVPSTKALLEAPDEDSLDVEAGIRYWRSKVKSAKPLNELYGRPFVRSEDHVSTKIFWRIDSAIQKQLVTLARSYRSHVAPIFGAIVTLYLHKVTNRDTVTLITPFGNRTASNKNHLGSFVQQNCLNISVEDGDTFKDLVLRFRNALGETKPHRGQASTVPLVELGHLVSFNYYESSVVQFEEAEVRSTIVHPDYDLESIHFLFRKVIEVDNEIRFEVQAHFSRSAFDADMIEEAFSHFKVLALGLLCAPEAEVKSHPLLESPLETPDYGASIDVNRLPSVVELFESRARTSPNKVAIRDVKVLTYEEIRTESNKIAGVLDKRIGDDESPVCICIPKTAELYIFVLGVMKSGRPVILLDFEWPVARIEKILSVVHPAAIVCTEDIVDTYADVVLDPSDLKASAKSKSTKYSPRTDAYDGIAYIAFTSGSTGEPMGVSISHRALAITLCSYEAYYEISRYSHCHLQAASPGFDVFYAEMFRALCFGAALVPATMDVVANPSALHNIIQRQCVDFVELVPACYRHLREYLLAGSLQLESIKYLLIGSDLLYRDEFGNNCRELFPNGRFFNTYGITEATIDSTVFEGPSAKTDAETIVPIGKALAHAHLIVLDSFLNEVPTGVEGELYIGGIGLADGYYGNENATSRKFVQVTINGQKRRFLKSGDMVRVDRYGNYHFIGRKDQQIKLNGVRIELEEIESAMTSHPEVKIACAIAKKFETKGLAILGFYETVGGSLIDSQGMRRYLLSLLPTSAVPFQIQRVTKIPTTSNGKIDRVACEAFSSAKSDQSKPSLHPKSQLERSMCRIWAEVLGIDTVFADDNFFDVGGDSISAHVIAAKARNKGVNVSPKEILSEPVLCALCKDIERNSNGTSRDGTFAGGRNNGKWFGLTPIQAWFLEERGGNVNRFNQSILVSTFREMNFEIFERALKKVVSNHQVFRLRFRSKNGHWEQKVSDCEEFRVTRIVIENSTPDSCRRRIRDHIKDVQGEFCIESGLTLNVLFFDLPSDTKPWINFTAHHLIIDGISWALFLNELGDAYSAIVNDHNFAPSSESTTFEEWSYHLESMYRRGVFEEEASYWRQVTGIPTPKIATIDLTGRAANRATLARTETWSLSTAETRRLLQKSAEDYGVTLDRILLAAFGVAYREWTSHERCIVNMESHGRHDPLGRLDISQTIGWFTSVFPLILELPANDDVAEFVRSIDGVLKQVPNLGIGYGIIRQHANGNSELPSCGEAAEISFNYMGTFSNTGPVFLPLFQESHLVEGLSDPNARRRYLINLDAIVVEDQLSFTWRYGSEFFDRSTIQRLADRQLQYIRHVIERDSP